jgi:hypothetical protein
MAAEIGEQPAVWRRLLAVPLATRRTRGAVEPAGGCTPITDPHACHVHRTGAVAVPMTYGAIVWFAHPASEPAPDVPPNS